MTEIFIDYKGHIIRIDEMYSWVGIIPGTHTFRNFSVMTDSKRVDFDTQKEAEAYLDKYYHNKQFHNKLENIIDEKEE